MTAVRGTTFVLALGFLGLILGAGEILARTDAVRARIPPPSMGSSHLQFEVAISKLDAFVAQHGHVDCLLIGSSVVHNGIVPTVFYDAYRESGGRDVHCFNFGIPGIAMSTAGMLAEILVRRYHPALLIYGTTAREFCNNDRWKRAWVIEQIPWVQYQMGAFTIAGWLTEHSQLYRYYLAHRNWMTPDYWHALNQRRAAERWTSVDGFAAKGEKHARPQPHVLTIRSNWKMPTAARDGLTRLSRLAQQGVRIILLEIPVAATALELFHNGKSDAERIMDAVERYAGKHAIVTVRTSSLSLIPDDGWVDMGHMNVKGARIFSAWLGHQMASSAAF